MDKLAQKRSTFDKYIREPANIGGQLAENFFDPEFKDVMDRLRNETDDPVRKLMLGEEGDDNMPLKEVLKLAKKYFNQREYLKCVDAICRFHNRMIPVVKLLTDFSGNLDAAHQQFLTKGLDPEELQYLQKHKKAFSKNYILKAAGIMPDFLLDVKDFIMGEERPRALRAWEKRYPGKLKELKKFLSKLLISSEKLFNVSVLSLKGMSRARADRKVDNYTADALKIIKGFEAFNTEFDAFKTKFDKDVFNNPMLVSKPATEKTKVIDTDDIKLRIKLDKVEEKSRKLKELQKKYKPDSEEYELIEEKLALYKQEYLDLKNEPKSISNSEPPMKDEVPEIDIPEPKPDINPYLRDDAVTTVLPSKLPSVAPPSLPEDDELNTIPITDEKTTPIPSKAPKTLLDFGKGSQPNIIPNFDEDKEFKQKFNAPLTPTQQKMRLITQQIDQSLKEKDNKRLDEEIAKVNAHQEFYENLESLSNQDSKVLKQYISKYAKLIQFSDPKTYISLLNISKNI